MREIRFRAWIKKDKKMFYQNDQYLQSFLRRATSMSNIEQRDHEKYGDYELNQYTGLKDKNGKEIYEGDVVIYTSTDCENTTYRDTYEVIFNAPTFKIKAIRSHIYKSGAIIYLNEEVEVIGNIHENQDLLKTA